MEKIPATVCMLTRNSAQTLRRALESVAAFDDVVIFDGGSTDNTVEIARSCGARVLSQDSTCLAPDGRIKDYGCARNIFIREAKYDWVLYMDSDESISQGLIAEVREIVAREAQEIAFRIPIRICLEGQELRASSNYPGWQTRLFRRSSGLTFIKPVHERLSVTIHDPRVGECRSPWYVHWTREYARNYLSHNLRYIRMQAESHSRASLGTFLRRDIVGNLVIAAKVLVKTLYIRIRYGTRDVVPLSAEFGRALVPLVLLALTLRTKLQKLA